MMNVPTIEAIVKIHRKSLSRTIATKPQSWSSCGAKKNYKIKNFYSVLFFVQGLEYYTYRVKLVLPLYVMLNEHHIM